MKSLFKNEIKAFCRAAKVCCGHGWTERNGGNLSYRLPDLKGIDIPALRRFDLQCALPSLDGEVFLVTGTGKYFRNVARDPENNIGLVRIAKGGKVAELLWGLKDGGAPTSELSAHLMSHAARLAVDPAQRVVLHQHPVHLIAASMTLPADARTVTRALWQVMTESLVVFPEGVCALPWMICGGPEIGKATAEALSAYRIVLWGLHGAVVAATSLDEAVGLLEVAEKAAHLHTLTANLPRQVITDEQLQQIADFFGVKPKEGFLG